MLFVISSFIVYAFAQMPLITMTTILAAMCYLSLSTEAFPSHYHYSQTTVTAKSSLMMRTSSGHNNPVSRRRNTAAGTHVTNFANKFDNSKNIMSCNPFLHCNNRESSTAMKMSLSVRGGAEAATT